VSSGGDETGPVKTLFVDDEPDFETLIRQRYRRKIRSGEIAVEFAQNGREALEKLSSDDEIAIVMTDINMPVMDGLTLLGELASLEQEVPAVIVSAYGDMGNIRTAMNLGAFDFLTKPIDFNDLDITWRKTAEHRRRLDERRRLEEERHRLEEKVAFVRGTFGRYLSDTVVERLLEDPEGLRLGGERRDLSILMADLRGFSPLAERLLPEDCLAVLNNYFEVMIDVIMDHGGIIDELLGDAMLLIFGAPLVQEDHALRAVSCAVAMQRSMEIVNRANVGQDLPKIEMGIGISSGEVVVGNIGSRRRTKFGVVGSHVNLAARIESRSVGGQVLISDGTYRRCAGQVEVEPQAEFIAKGFRDPIRTYSLRRVKGAEGADLPMLDHRLRPLTEPLPMRFIPLADGGDHRVREGRFVELSDGAAIIEGKDCGGIEPIVPVRIQLLDAAGGIDCEELYGKVVACEQDRLRVYFTAVPPRAEALIRERLEAGGQQGSDASTQGPQR
jgi:class 3 adenylate cyclase